MRQITFPDGFEEIEWEIQKKGWLADVAVDTGPATYILEFFDVDRFKQEIDDELVRAPAYAPKNVVVVNVVNRAEIEAAIEYLASSGTLATMKAV